MKFEKFRAVIFSRIHLEKFLKFEEALLCNCPQKLQKQLHALKLYSAKYFINNLNYQLYTIYSKYLFKDFKFFSDLRALSSVTLLKYIVTLQKHLI